MAHGGHDDSVRVNFSVRDTKGPTLDQRSAEKKFFGTLSPLDTNFYPLKNFLVKI